ncbi:hypothetical protein ACHAXS_008241 [Conticribra weissflogii]
MSQAPLSSARYSQTSFSVTAKMATVSAFLISLNGILMMTQTSDNKREKRETIIVARALLASSNSSGGAVTVRTVVEAKEASHYLEPTENDLGRGIGVSDRSSWMVHRD